MKKDNQWYYLVLCAIIPLFFTACGPAAGSASRGQPAITSDPGDWPGYLLDNDRDDFNPTETAITASTAPQLKLHWKVPGKSRVFSQPVVFRGVIYWGSSDGIEHATDLNGRSVWERDLGASHAICDNDADDKNGVLDTATVAPVTIRGTSMAVVFVGGGDGRFYALNAATGAVIWSRVLGKAPDTFLWSSPAVYKGKVYEGVSSLADCPLIQGRLVQMDASTGAITHTFDTVPDGCLGGSIWSSPTIDPKEDAVYVSTGNPGSCPAPEPYAPALIKLRASDLAFVDAWQVPQGHQIVDSDFGATPTLFEAQVAGAKKQMVGAVNKNGTYYAFDRASVGQGPVWTVQAGGVNTLAPSAWDGTYLYVGGRESSLGGKPCNGILQALEPSTGAYIWRHCLGGGSVVGAITLVPGVAIVSEGTYFLAVATADGHTLFRYTDAQADFVGPASISNGVLYIGSYTGGLYAFGL